MLSIGTHREDPALLDFLPVTDWVRDYELAYYDYMNKKQYDDGATTNSQYMIGYLKVLSDTALNEVKDKTQQGWTVDIRMVRAPVTLIYNPEHTLNGQIYKRYAAVSLTGEYEFTFTKGAESQKVTVNIDSIVYLKKVNNEKWEIYGSLKL